MCILIFLGVAIFSGYDMTTFVLNRGTLSAVLQIPIWIVYSSLPVGCTLMGYQMILNLFHQMAEPRRAPRAEAHTRRTIEGSPVILIVIFAFFLLIGTPIAFVLGLVGLSHLAMIRPLNLLPMVMQRMIDGPNNFVLVAVPMFMLAGNLMNAAGITRRLIALSDALVGWLRGGLAHVTVVVSMIFAGITGIATAETVALGTTLIPAMEKQHYDKKFATGLIAWLRASAPLSRRAWPWSSSPSSEKYPWESSLRPDFCRVSCWDSP